MQTRRLFTLGVLALTLAAFGLVATGAQAKGPNGKQVCGTLPGEGYYSYIKARNVSCKIAKKVTRRAADEFCANASNCDAPPTGPVDEGKVTAKGWKCEMKVGYEFFQAKCERGNQKFKAESAA